MGRDTPIRLLRVFGHQHFWTTNFTAWIERANSTEPEVIYQSFDWEDMPTFRYDSVAMNRPPDPELEIDGAVSGICGGPAVAARCFASSRTRRAPARRLPGCVRQGRTRVGSDGVAHPLPRSRSIELSYAAPGPGFGTCIRRAGSAKPAGCATSEPGSWVHG